MTAAGAESRAAILATFGADEAVTAELLAYDADGFNGPIDREIRFPLADEPFVETWHEYARDVAAASDFRVLAGRLVQLSFPIHEGMSNHEAYRAATRRGVPPHELSGATGLELERPDAIEIEIHATWAGAIPLILVPSRTDFVSLVRAFSGRNEPTPIPASMGASIIAGYNNWDRFRRLQQQWVREHPGEPFSIDRIAHLKDSYQDRFILLSGGWYSGVSPKALGLDEEEWRRLSLLIRRDHECAHYWTRRVRSSMRNCILDEIVADYCGIAGACGRFRADWLLAFFGLEDGRTCRPGGRLHNYRGQPPLSDTAFTLVQQLVISAAINLEAFDTRHAELRGDLGALLALLTLSSMCLEHLAAPHAHELLDEALEQSMELLQAAETTLIIGH
jgi:hypothetical protein